MISAVIIAKNEEENIIDCINSLAWCDEIVVIDDYSSDKTTENIIKLQNSKIRVYKHHLNDNFSEQRNFGMNKAQGEWVLFVDADERINESLQYEILNVTNASVDNFSGFLIKRTDFMWGTKMRYGESSMVKLLRLGRKKASIWKGKVHETWRLKGRIGELKNPIHHFPHKNIAVFLKEINYYTTLRAEELFSKGVRVNYISIILYPAAKFIYNYILRCGFLDGIPGLLMALMMSFHSFLVRSKLWVIWQKKSS